MANLRGGCLCGGSNSSSLARLMIRPVFGPTMRKESATAGFLRSLFCWDNTNGIVMSGRAPADQGLFFGVALVANAVMSSAFFCGE
jgi:hypothetical protein